MNEGYEDVEPPYTSEQAVRELFCGITAAPLSHIICTDNPDGTLDVEATFWSRPGLDFPAIFENIRKRMSKITGAKFWSISDKAWERKFRCRLPKAALPIKKLYYD